MQAEQHVAQAPEPGHPGADVLLGAQNGVAIEPPRLASRGSTALRKLHVNKQVRRLCEGVDADYGA